MGYWLFWYGGWNGPEGIGIRWTRPRFGNSLGNPALRADAEALLFSCKSFAAAMLAYYIALRIGLPRPSWAIVTVYLVSQPSAGASLGRGVYRLVGTLVGALATVAILPTFANEPLVCSLVLAGWIGLCLFLSLLDRTPRAYAFVLSGYTASLIGFPAVAEPGAIFDTAAVRVQEIALGILCAVLVHRYVLPRRMTGQFLGKLSATLRDARELAGDALHDVPDSRRRADRHRLVLDLLAIRGMATHLRYDPARASPERTTLLLLHDRLARLLPLLAEIEERIDAIAARTEAVPAEAAHLLLDVRRWIATDIPFDRETDALWLVHRAGALANARAETVADGLGANLAGHLEELVGLLHDCERLGQAAAASMPRRQARPLGAGERATGYVFHRDPVTAARAAAGAVLGIFIGCVAWIWSAWSDGGLALSVLGVTCALFGNVDAPAPNVRKYMLGSLYGVAASLAYSFVVLPRVTEFTVLVAVLAPVFLFAGSLQARPATAFMALGITLTVPILVGLGGEYGGDFAEAINSSIALFVATGFGALSMTLFQTFAPDRAIDRLLRLGRRDVARRARGKGPAEAAWTGLMIDRAALLLPRLGASERSTMQTFDETLRHLRTGHAAARLHEQLGARTGSVADDARRILSDLANGISRAPTAETAELSRDVESLVARVAASRADADRPLLDPLIDLRFALARHHDGHGSA
ncbi:FUSC family protein [Sphingomonas sp. Sphisp140]|uniref:FUSC family protein n=1 Tax=unclassified Sphingomonas TaxID=196159 RepID=UPI0039AFE5D0